MLAARPGSSQPGGHAGNAHEANKIKQHYFGEDSLTRWPISRCWGRRVLVAEENQLSFSKLVFLFLETLQFLPETP